MITPTTQVIDALASAMWDALMPLGQAPQRIIGGDVLVTAMTAQGVPEDKAILLARVVMVRLAQVALQAVYPALIEVGWKAVPVEGGALSLEAMQEAGADTERAYRRAVQLAPDAPGAEPPKVVN